MPGRQLSGPLNAGNDPCLRMDDTESYTDRSADALAPSCYGHSRTDHCPNGRAIAESGCWSRHDADAAEHATRQPTSPGRTTLGAAARRQLRESRSPRSSSPGRRPTELAPRSALWRALRHDVRVTRNSCSLDAFLVPVRPTQRARPRSHSESGHGPESGTHRVPSQRHTVEE